MMRIVYSGKKPLNLGINKAKRVAHRADKKDREAVLKVLGSGLPHPHVQHQELVRMRHRYYREQSSAT